MYRRPDRLPPSRRGWPSVVGRSECRRWVGPRPGLRLKRRQQTRARGTWLRLLRSSLVCFLVLGAWPSRGRGNRDRWGTKWVGMVGPRPEGAAAWGTRRFGGSLPWPARTVLCTVSVSLCKQAVYGLRPFRRQKCQIIARTVAAVGPNKRHSRVLARARRSKRCC